MIEYRAILVFIEGLNLPTVDERGSSYARDRAIATFKEMYPNGVVGAGQTIDVVDGIFTVHPCYESDGTNGRPCKAVAILTVIRPLPLPPKE